MMGIRSATASRVGVAVKEAVAVGIFVTVEEGDGRKGDGLGVEVERAAGGAPQAEKIHGRNAKAASRQKHALPRRLAPRAPDLKATGSRSAALRARGAEIEISRDMRRLYLKVIRKAEYSETTVHFGCVPE